MKVGFTFTYPGKKQNYNTSVVEVLTNHKSVGIKNAVKHGLSVVRVKMKGTNEYVAGIFGFEQTIILGDKWFELSKNTKEAVIFHELGHYLFKHYLDENCKTPYRQECEADLYALIHCGKENIIKANKESKPKWHKKKINFLNSVELEKGIEEKEKQNGLKLLEGTKIYKITSSLRLDVKVLGTNEIIVSDRFLKTFDKKEREIYYLYQQLRNYNIEKSKKRIGEAYQEISEMFQKDVLEVVRKIEQFIK